MLHIAVFVLQRQSWELSSYLSLHRKSSRPFSRWQKMATSWFSLYQEWPWNQDLLTDLASALRLSLCDSIQLGSVDWAKHGTDLEIERQIRPTQGTHNCKEDAPQIGKYHPSWPSKGVLSRLVKGKGLYIFKLLTAVLYEVTGNWNPSKGTGTKCEVIDCI